MTTTNKITVLGAGSWGTTIANTLALNGHKVTLWCYEPEVAQTITEERINKTYLPDVFLSKLIHATCNITDAISSSNIIIEAIPIAYLRTILELAQSHILPTAKWIVLSKGIEQKTLLFPSQIIESIINTQTSIAVIGGPNFAKELGTRQFTATVIASKDSSWAKEIAELLFSNTFLIYQSNDPIGLQICGALKNVLALLVGIAQGFGYGYNAVAYLITQGLTEIASLVHTLGGVQQTVFGLAGLGDLVLTCTATSQQNSEHVLSKNLRVGVLLGKGVSYEKLLNHMLILPEGINTVQSLYEIITQKKLNLPLLEGTYKCIFGNKQINEIMQELSINYTTTLNKKNNS